MEPAVSIICIANDTEVYEGFLESLRAQIFTDHELIPVMNLNNEYTSARRAYNEAAASASGRYLLFLHPDIRFNDENALGDIISALPESFGTCGIAGAIRLWKYKREILTTIVHGSGRIPAGRSITGPEEVQTLDECFFIIENKYFKSHPFSGKEGWHLYAAEYCLNCIRDGRRNYVVPARVWHMSDGRSLNAQYVLQVEQLIDEQKDWFDLICTTVKAWRTRGTAALLYRKYYYNKQRLKSIIRK